MTPSISRRTLLAAGAFGGLAATGLAGCATSGGAPGGSASRGPVTADNPLGVPAGAPLEAVIFKGGYGDQYVIDAEAAYSKLYPDAKITHFGGQELAKLLQPRFIAADVPDLIDNSGAGALVVPTLVENQQLMDLTPLLDAPAVDGNGKTVRETLRPGTVEIGSFGATPYGLNYAFVVHGLWYSSSLFAKRGWEVPTTWPDMIDLCTEIQRTLNVSPWTYQGKNPGYILTPLVMSAIKAGGPQTLKDLDNLAEGVWQSEPIMAAAESYYQLVEKKLIKPGTSGLTHTQAQTYWAKGEAVFIPCGSWLESELGDVTPEGFDMKVFSPPAVTDHDVLPVTAIRGAANEQFIVPSAAKNPWGAMELIRILLSPQHSQAFTEQTQTLTSLDGYTPTNAGTGLTSVTEALEKSGQDTFYWRYGSWYPKLTRELEAAITALMTGEINPDAWAKRCQAAADAVRNDPSIPKNTRD